MMSTTNFPDEEALALLRLSVSLIAAHGSPTQILEQIGKQARVLEQMQPSQMLAHLAAQAGLLGALCMALQCQALKCLAEEGPAKTNPSRPNPNAN